MTSELGAHETLELHEVLTDTIDGINQFQLYRQHVKDPQLASIMDKQLTFMAQEYNNLVQAMNQKGMTNAIPYRAPRNFSPVYGLRHPGSQTPNLSANEMDDQDISSSMMGCHKATATMRMRAALECANPEIRHFMQQAAINSSEQAYEVWQYMNQKGFHHVPTLKDQTTGTMIGTYTSTPMGQASQGTMEMRYHQQ